VSVADSLAAWHERLKGVTITQRDGFKLLGRIPDERGVAIYCDPPYLVKDNAYVHDFAADDHQRLADALARFRQARVIVSYYDHPALGDLYPGWQVRHVQVVKSITNSARGKTRQVAPEVLLVNRPGEVAAVASPGRSRIGERQRLLCFA
jgi:DNA adenine methylase